MFEKLINWVKANWFLTTLGVIGFTFFLSPKNKEDLLATVFIIYVLEQVARMIYKETIIYVMHDNKLKPLFTGADGILSKNETLGLTIFQTGALFSARMIVGLIALGIYFSV